MNKILLIIKREYMSRVKKKSFIVMTILGPILLAGIMIVPIYLALRKTEVTKIEVLDNSHLFTNLIPESEIVHFEYPLDAKGEVPIIDSATHQLYRTDYDAILYIPKNVLEGGAEGITLHFKKQINQEVIFHLNDKLKEILMNAMLAVNHVNIDDIKTAKQKSEVKILTIHCDERGKEKETDTGLYTAIGIGLGALIYTFILLYSVQVMRGVMEEKTSRIVEVILSSVKPFQLMMGKIVGVALVGLTQFLLWVILTFTLYSVAAVTILKDVDMKQIQKKETIYKHSADLDYNNFNKIEKANNVTKVWNDFKVVNVPEILLCFLFYFLAGYLMYSSLFAAVGSAVDSETDTQQFMMPLTIPLILSFVMAQFVIQNPESQIAFWFSIFPLTSPIIMMVRIPFGVPPWEMALSMSLLVVGFIFTTWLAARIYRTGILMYGKKVTWKELGKWLFYKG